MLVRLLMITVFASVFAHASNGQNMVMSGRPVPNALRGINLAGAEFGDTHDRLGKDYTYPELAEISYFAQRGFNLVRLPFKTRRLIRDSEGAPRFFETDLRAIHAIVAHAAKLRMSVLLDMHDYGLDRLGRRIAGGQAARIFSDDWALIAAQFRNAPNVAFGLMNEPHFQSPREWLSAANQAVVAIRRTGAGQPIFVSGADWDSAERWERSGNAAAFADLADPMRNVVIEVHHYLDHDRSGRSPMVASGTGVSALAAVTSWARRTGNRLFLGEIGWADTAEANLEGRDVLHFLATNGDVWEGWAYWAAGPWWGAYMFSVAPGRPSEARQLRVLMQFTLPFHPRPPDREDRHFTVPVSRRGEEGEGASA